VHKIQSRINSGRRRRPWGSTPTSPDRGLRLPHWLRWGSVSWNSFGRHGVTLFVVPVSVGHRSQLAPTGNTILFHWGHARWSPVRLKHSLCFALFARADCRLQPRSQPFPKARAANLSVDDRTRMRFSAFIQSGVRLPFASVLVFAQCNSGHLQLCRQRYQPGSGCSLAALSSVGWSGSVHRRIWMVRLPRSSRPLSSWRLVLWFICAWPTAGLGPMRERAKLT